MIFWNGVESIVTNNLTILRAVSLLPPNPFKDVLMFSSLKPVIHISSKVDLNRTSIELPESTSIRSNFLLATTVLISIASSCRYNTYSSSSSVHIMGTYLVFAHFASGKLNKISLLVIAYLV